VREPSTLFQATFSKVRYQFIQAGWLGFHATTARLDHGFCQIRLSYVPIRLGRLLLGATRSTDLSYARLYYYLDS